MRAWSLYMHTGENPYVGHGGYDDVAGRWYSYDSDVANHRNVGVGDLIVLRNRDSAIGIGFIEQIDRREATKRHHRCPECNTSQLEARSTLSPKFRCTNGHVFGEPVSTDDSVVRYRAEFPHAYLDFDGLTSEELERLSLSRSRQNAIRELDIDGTLTHLRDHGIFPAFVRGSS